MLSGDLVFSFIGPEANAISDVTEGYRGARVNHVGIIVQTALGIFVLEAFHPEVRLTHFEVFSRRSHDDEGVPRLLIGRLHSDFDHLIEPAIQYGITRRNVPYDELYLTGESALYCSELVVDMFKHANNNTPFFVETSMSFRDTETGEIHPTWKQYYAYFGMPVPEGEPGSNPGEISNDHRLDIYLVSGSIPGYGATV